MKDYSHVASPLDQAKRRAEWHKQCRDAEGDKDPRNERPVRR